MTIIKQIKKQGNIQGSEMTITIPISQLMQLLAKTGFEVFY